MDQWGGATTYIYVHMSSFSRTSNSNSVADKRRAEASLAGLCAELRSGEAERGPTWGVVWRERCW